MAKERKLTVEEVAKRLNDRKSRLEHNYKIWIHTLCWNNWVWYVSWQSDSVVEITSPEWIDYKLENWVWVEF